MGRRPLIAKQYRHFGNAELALCFQPQVRIYTLVVFLLGESALQCFATRPALLSAPVH